MTYQEALDKGYRHGDLMYQRGYVSRKVDVASQPVKTAGKGRRHGQLYVELPCYHSTWYSLRQYLIRD